MATENVSVDVIDALDSLIDLGKSVRALSEAALVASGDSNQSITGLAYAGCLVACDIEAQLKIINGAFRGTKTEAAA